MRTTVDLDEELVEQARKRFPPGTPKTVVLEEALRALLALPAESETRQSANLRALVRSGLVTLPRAAGTPPEGPGARPLQTILEDLDRDRAER